MWQALCTRSGPQAPPCRHAFVNGETHRVCCPVSFTIARARALKALQSLSPSAAPICLRCVLHDCSSGVNATLCYRSLLPCLLLRRGTVCQRGFLDTSASTVCRALGYGGGAIRTGAAYGQGTLPIHFSQVRCPAGAVRLAECAYSLKHTCDHSEDVGIACQEGGGRRLLITPGRPWQPPYAASHTGTQQLLSVSLNRASWTWPHRHIAHVPPLSAVAREPGRAPACP